MLSLPGGTFLMGTDYQGAFAADGEGPVRPVAVAPFRIDPYPVTNAEFAAFVRATGYRTESEVFGWSFCFWMQLPPDQLDALVEDTVAAAPWWCVVRGADWAHPEGPASDVFAREYDRSKHPACMCRGTTRQRMRPGQASSFRRRHSGSTRRVGGSCKNSIHGETI